MFGVLVHRADSIYADSPAVQYQFPPQYLSRAAACVGDWIVYYEPTKVTNSKGYFAIAKVADVRPDPANSKMHLALIEPGTYLDFSSPVPFIDSDGITEVGLLNAEGKISGRAQAAVRALSASDFRRIVARGLDDGPWPLPRDQPEDGPILQFEESQAPFVGEYERERLTVLTSRIVRDRVFRKVILTAYDERCGITGLKFVNGGGRAEVAAAHIRPVEANGPDIVNNGIALSGTAHWMFDRGLITITDDLEILVSRHVNDHEGANGLVNRSRRLIGPLSMRDRPHPAFLGWHRENCFKH